MSIYVSSDVQMNEDKYVNFLLSTCDYNNEKYRTK